MRPGLGPFYGLDADHNVIPVEGVEQWRMAVVAKSQDDEILVSTIFIGIDHNFFGAGPPLVFETMVFGGALDQEQRRYATWAEAEAGHADMVRRVTEAEIEAQIG